jgi:hypothetical protein
MKKGKNRRKKGGEKRGKQKEDGNDRMRERDSR